ncbi:MAG: glycoside hydrolase family 28 protein [Bacteroidales bacterium]|nr:glycoside hydrolase family 28 protein [Bacteroidales bacterium]
MKNTYILTMACALASCTSMKQQSAIDNAFADAEAMVSAMTVPSFCTDTFNIVDFGASQSADAMDNQKAILSAIDSCNAVGGGCVFIPEGEWLTGPITLKSNVNLVVGKNAHVMFSKNYNDYLPAVLTRWEGVDCYNLKPLIYAYGAVNVGITGEGVIDGQGSVDNWWYMKGRPQYGWKEGLISQEHVGRPRLLEADRTQIPVEERVMGIEDGLRPQLINIYNCENVIIEGVTLKDSPFWVIHPLCVTNLIVRNVTIDGDGPNSDGCDPESCKNVLIEGCSFNTGDDCIAIKSGRNYDGRRWARPSENIYVRNCIMKNGHGGVVLGSEISGGYKNLWVENCKMSSPELERVIRIKTSDCRGGVIENVFVRNVEVGECQEAILKINLLYEPKEICNRNFPPVVRNVNIENIQSEKSKYGVYIVGLPGSENVSDINVKNCNFNGVESGNKVTDAIRVTYDNLLINGTAVAE